jgi:hypothetical protein
MHFLTSLIIICGFVFVLCFGLVQVISVLSEMSVHAPPEMLPTPCGRVLEAEQGHADATELYESNPSELSETRVISRRNECPTQSCAVD